MNTRKCKKCGQVKLLDQFANAGIIKGVSYKRHQCISCYSKIKMEKSREKINNFREYKKTLKCERCGFSDYRALQFHHKDSNKEGTVAVMARSHSWDSLYEEIVKCEVLCANCHQIEHYNGA